MHRSLIPSPDEIDNLGVKQGLRLSFKRKFSRRFKSTNNAAISLAITSFVMYFFYSNNCIQSVHEKGGGGGGDMD